MKRFPSIIFCTLLFLISIPTFSVAYDHADLLTEKYGYPDKFSSTEYENPKPPIVTKRLIYNTPNGRLRAVYFLERNGEWKLMGFQNDKTNAVIQPSVAYEWLDARKKSLNKKKQ